MDLILTSYGSSLTKEDDCFCVFANGKKQKIAVHDIRSIQLCRGIMASSDAIMLAINNEIEVLFVENDGKPQGRIWSPKYGSIATIRKGQLLFSMSSMAVQWIKEELIQKVENQQALILSLSLSYKSVKRSTDKAVERLEDYKTKIRNTEGNSIDDVAATLRGLEGNASRIYFETINLMLPDNYKMNSRSQHPARDITNAFLNYGYGILYGRIEGALIKAGIDPYIGIMHRDEYNRPVLVYDFIERYRVWVDSVVCNLLMQLDIDESFYHISDEGAYWLEGLGRRILIQGINDYMEEIIEVGSLTRSRQTQLQIAANELAKIFAKTTKLNESC